MVTSTMEATLTLEKRLRRTAQHEVLHSLYATSCGWVVDEVRCHPTGVSRLHWPFPIRDLCPRFRAQPLQTMARLRQVGGMLLAPYVVLDSIPRGEHPMQYA